MPGGVHEEGLSIFGLRKSKLYSFLNDFRDCQLLIQGVSMVHSQNCDKSTNDVLIRIFLHVDLFLYVTNHTERMHVSAHIVSCCIPGGFLRFMNIYIYIYSDQHLMGNGINFINQQHIPKSAFMSVN